MSTDGQKKSLVRVDGYILIDKIAVASIAVAAVVAVRGRDVIVVVGITCQIISGNILYLAK